MVHGAEDSQLAIAIPAVVANTPRHEIPVRSVASAALGNGGGQKIITIATFRILPVVRMQWISVVHVP